MTITFNNVSITVDAPSAAEAYQILGQAIARDPRILMQTDSFHTYDRATNEETEGDTLDLMRR